MDVLIFFRYDELVVGSPFYSKDHDNPEQGRVFVYSHDNVSVRSFVNGVNQLFLDPQSEGSYVMTLVSDYQFFRPSGYNSKITNFVNRLVPKKMGTLISVFLQSFLTFFTGGCKDFSNFSI